MPVDRGGVIQVSNTARLGAKLPPLKEDAYLNEIAQQKAEDMARRSYLSHSSPEGKKIQDGVDKKKYKYIALGENLAVNFSDLDSMQKSWLASPTHKKNILSKQYSDAGIGIASGTYKGVPGVNFVVVVFGKKQK